MSEKLLLAFLSGAFLGVMWTAFLMTVFAR